MEITAQKVAAKVGELVAILAAVGFVASLWIDREVERRMNELAIDPSAAPAVVELQTEMENVETTLGRVENKVDDFSREFMAYLQRQTE